MDTSDTYSCAARVMNDTIASTTNKEYTWSLQFNCMVGIHGIHCIHGRSCQSANTIQVNPRGVCAMCNTACNSCNYKVKQYLTPHKTKLTSCNCNITLAKFKYRCCIKQILTFFWKIIYINWLKIIQAPIKVLATPHITVTDRWHQRTCSWSYTSICFIKYVYSSICIPPIPRIPGYVRSWVMKRVLASTMWNNSGSF